VFEIRLATVDDQEDILALVEEMIPNVDARARWDWLYETNPGGRALTWIASENDQIAGCTSFFPFRMWLDGQEVRGALGGDGYVRPAFRRRGLGGLLHDASRRDMPAHRIGCMYGAPGAMNVTPLKHGGSREVGSVSRWARPLRGTALRLAPLDGVIAYLLEPARVRAATLEPMEPMDERVDEVWQAARSELRLACIRDAAFYTWRFLAAPAHVEPAFVIVDRKKQPIGACALEAMNDGKTLHIVDLVAVPGKWNTCLRAIARYGVEETRAQVCDIKLFTLDGRRRQMWRAGFTEREGKPFLCMIPKDGDRRFVDPDRWYYCGGDSDLDRLS
jgi:GNAT superfamily N-acetyltransferase